MEHSFLYQSTHSRVASSTSERERHGPSRWISGLNRPVVISARVQPERSRSVAAIERQQPRQARPDGSRAITNQGTPAAPGRGVLLASLVQPGPVGQSVVAINRLKHLLLLFGAYARPRATGAIPTPAFIRRHVSYRRSSAPSSPISQLWRQSCGAGSDPPHKLDPPAILSSPKASPARGVSR